MTINTGPKPFVFVLMPFDKSFNDIYKFGIKGAAEDAGAYAERLDEQVFAEGMLDRIFNQINKADVIVADMSGRNPNVFYEVGYAHALNKLVILLTKDPEDIPFDLKHRQHIIYNGQIETLREQLSRTIVWAIQEIRSKKHIPTRTDFDVYVDENRLVSGTAAIRKIEKRISNKLVRVKLQIENLSSDALDPISHVYFLLQSDSIIRPLNMQVDSITNVSHLWKYAEVPQKKNIETGNDRELDQYRLGVRFPSIPPKAIESNSINLLINRGPIPKYNYMILRIHYGNKVLDYPFSLDIELANSSNR